MEHDNDAECYCPSCQAVLQVVLSTEMVRTSRHAHKGMASRQLAELATRHRGEDAVGLSPYMLAKADTDWIALFDELATRALVAHDPEALAYFMADAA